MSLANITPVDGGKKRRRAIIGASFLGVGKNTRRYMFGGINRKGQ